MEYLSKMKFPLNSKDYKLYEEVGEGVSATVYRALCIPLNKIVAIKVLDLERCNNDLDGIHREVQTMGLINHPNILRAHCSFTDGSHLWIVMPYMAGGSCLHIMKSSYPEGFEQAIIATLLREVLKALVYLHCHGHIHRDVKAGNILVDSKGAVKLADFGVSACVFDTGDRQRSRKTFVGTPCWMAPEVMEQLHGYDFKADVWSFGITALELAHGHAPFSKYPPMKVLLMTLQNAPPGLDYERDQKFSKSFKDIVAACLVKDPKRRPTSDKLLKHRFFKHARSNEFLAQNILDGLDPLGERFRMLKAKEADFLIQNRAMNGNNEHLYQVPIFFDSSRSLNNTTLPRQVYKQGISAWNFNLEDLKIQASLIEDYNSISNMVNQDLSIKQNDELDTSSFSVEWMSVEQGELNNRRNYDCSAASFPIHSSQLLEGQIDIFVNDVNACEPSWKDVGHSIYEECLEPASRVESKQTRVLPENDLPSSGEVNGDEDSNQLLHDQRMDLDRLPSVEDALLEPGFQCKGQFKVSVADFGLKDFENGLIKSRFGVSPTSTTCTVSSILPSLQCVLQQNTMQREQLMWLIKYVNRTDEFAVAAGTNERLKMSLVSARERDLEFHVIQMQQSIGRLIEELQKQRMKNAQLQSQLSALISKSESSSHLFIQKSS